jgi:hypothetical protein
MISLRPFEGRGGVRSALSRSRFRRESGLPEAPVVRCVNMKAVGSPAAEHYSSKTSTPGSLGFLLDASRDESRPPLGPGVVAHSDAVWLLPLPFARSARMYDGAGTEGLFDPCYFVLISQAIGLPLGRPKKPISYMQGCIYR